MRKWPEKAGTWQPLTRRAATRHSIEARPGAPIASQRAIEARCAHLGKTDLIQSNSDKHFLHTSVLLRHASGDSGEGERQIETILTKAVVAKRRVWVSSILFAELKPSMFVPGRFATLFELTRYLRSLAIFVTPDPNTMLRAARLRDAKWQRPHAVCQADEKPISLRDAIQIASALWVKEAVGVPDLKFLMFDDQRTDRAKGGSRLSELRLWDYADPAHANSAARAPVLSTRAQPALPAHAIPKSVPAQSTAPRTADGAEKPVASRVGSMPNTSSSPLD
jgi:hypothetical protein